MSATPGPDAVPPCAECGRPLEPNAVVGIGMPPRLVHVAPCFGTYLRRVRGAIAAAMRAAASDRVPFFDAAATKP